MAAFLALGTLQFQMAYAEEPIPAIDAVVADSSRSDSTFANLDSTSVLSADSVVVDSLLADMTPADTSVEPLSQIVDSLTTVDTVSTKAPNKTVVLYLGGGERSPWFHLGVLYAIESYGIPIDSIVATSWGAWVGSLWAKGVPLDEIQKLMIDSSVVDFIGHDLSSPKNTIGVTQRDLYEWPISMDGIPSFRQRFILSADSFGTLNRTKRSLQPDSLGTARAMAKLRFQESLNHLPVKGYIPVSVQRCSSSEVSVKDASVTEVMNSLPLWDVSMSGEVCPYYAVPMTESAEELSVVVVADPLRNNADVDERLLMFRQTALARMQGQKNVVVRAHTISDTSRTQWIQAGFSSMEKHLGDFKGQGLASKDYGAFANLHVAKSSSFTPSFDSVSAEVHSSLKAYWDESDSGFSAAKDFALNVLANPAYDSLRFNARPNGDLLVDVAVHPTFDFAVGGFGSNALGPNAYFESSLYYVDQMELTFMLAGFYGYSSYGIQPRLNISKLWNRHWGVQLGYDYLKLRPLKSFVGDVNSYLLTASETRSDFFMTLLYDFDEYQALSIEFLFGHREYEIDSLLFKKNSIKTYPVAPTLHYSYTDGDEDPWFASSGVAFNGYMGLESIGFDFGINDLVPIYWKLLADVRYSVSPKRFLTLSLGAAAGMERFHDEGYGYVYPKAFDYAPLDLIYRLHAHPTPWSTEWYDAELSSHEYGLVRGSASLHSDNLGLWIFAAYYHDFEDSPLAKLKTDKFILEPALRFSYRSLEIYAGLNRIVDSESFGDLKNFSDYKYFIRIGNYSF